jgi:2-C-methyl-D-erythritol 2,4-cyclodiphosphate synthase
MNIRVGFGYDVHVLDENRPMWLGGVLLEDAPKGALGHSDADVLLHAICDALLGAANMRDIGFHFSNTSEKYKNIDSKLLLAETIKLIASKGYRVINIDATVVLELPKINPHILAMQSVIAPLLHIDIDAISIKATTSETLGFVGRNEGVNASAVALIIKD